MTMPATVQMHAEAVAQLSMLLAAEPPISWTSVLDHSKKSSWAPPFPPERGTS